MGSTASLTMRPLCPGEKSPIPIHEVDPTGDLNAMEKKKYLDHDKIPQQYSL